MLTNQDPSGIYRITEIWDDETNRMTHKMCCVCFQMVAVENLWIDPETNLKWDLCSDACAVATFQEL